VTEAPGSCRLVDVGCCVCGPAAADPWAEGRDYEYETTADVFRMVRCRTCGLIYLQPRPSTDDLRTIYPPDYYAYNYDEAVHPFANRVKQWLDERKLQGWLGLCRTRQPWFLDVGCGNGRFLDALRRRGVPAEQLWGIELDDGVVARLRAQGYQARMGPIEAVTDLPAGRFDLIVLLQVIEHVADPAALVGRLARLLAPGGLLVIETPNVDSLDAALFRRRYWGGYHFPRHWNLFSPVTMGRLLAAHGLQVHRTRYLPAVSFWVYSLHHWVKYGWGRTRLARFFDPFRNLLLQAIFTGFDLARAAAGRRTSNMQVVATR
jgi:2-polyprenyl-3-methyl-5-hydroxy-6-metoxy-1,4-benzoquinol methylase